MTMTIFGLTPKKYLQDIEKFYICTDNDDKGEAVSEKIVQRLGRYRCERVLFKNKDANGDLIEGKNVYCHQSITQKISC